MPSSKYCGKCSSVKISALFNRDSTRHDGLSSSCKDCAKQTTKMWRERFPERAREAKKRWVRNNPEKERARMRKKAILMRGWTRAYYAEWNKRNKDKLLAYARKYRKANPDVYVRQVAKRTAQKLKAMPRWANEFFIEEAYRLAALRTKVLGYPWHVDHIVPLQSPIVCGLHVENNLRVIPAVVNLKKGNRHWPDMPEAICRVA